MTMPQITPGKEEFFPGGICRVTRTSTFSKKENTIEILATEEQFRLWRKGFFIQDVFPALTADEREFLMTGATSEEWEQAWPPEENDEAEIEALVREAWACSVANGYDAIHEEPLLESQNLADCDVDVERWVWAKGERFFDDRFAMLLKVVTRLQKEGL